jgi:ABC-2 type transport system ATP-binding protein
MPALSINSLNKSYGSFNVINDLDLQIERGSIHGLVGLNGSGKTTTIECILGLQRFNAGTISVLGFSPEQLHLAKGKLVSIFDSPSLHPNLTVRQCLDHALLLCEKPKRSAKVVEELLGISQFSNFKIKHLSMGNKRRSSIAQALLGEPELIVLDEPFNGLDAQGVHDVLKLITSLNREQGVTFLLSSHQLPYLEQICSHIAILHQGKIALSDSVEKLLAKSTSTVRLKTTQTDSASALIKNMQGIELLEIDTQGFLIINIQDGHVDSASINQALVEHGIAVSELALEQASLATLFQKITSGGRK